MRAAGPSRPAAAGVQTSRTARRSASCPTATTPAWSAGERPTPFADGELVTTDGDRRRRPRRAPVSTRSASGRDVGVALGLPGVRGRRRPGRPTASPWATSADLAPGLRCSADDRRTGSPTGPPLWSAGGLRCAVPRSGTTPTRSRPRPGPTKRPAAGGVRPPAVGRDARARRWPSTTAKWSSAAGGSRRPNGFEPREARGSERSNRAYCKYRTVVRAPANGSPPNADPDAEFVLPTVFPPRRRELPADLILTPTARHRPLFSIFAPSRFNAPGRYDPAGPDAPPPRAHLPLRPPWATSCSPGRSLSRWPASSRRVGSRYVTGRPTRGCLAERVLRLESADAEAGWHGAIRRRRACPSGPAKLLAGAHAVYTFGGDAPPAWVDERPAG